jgi:branched-chain amino acid transport system permease protein
MSMGFIVVVGDILRNWMSFTGGPWGIPDIPRPTLGEFTFTDNLHLFYLALGFLAVMTVFAIIVEDSRYGLAFKAVRDDQLATELCGLNSTQVKVAAFVLCGVFTGIAGAFFASFQTYISPDVYSFEYNAIFMCMLVVGGLSSIPGSILGGIILTVAIEVLRPLKEKYVTVFALIIILTLLFEPGGLMVLVGRTLVWLRRKGARRPPGRADTGMRTPEK